MNRFAELLDRLAYEPSRNNKLRLVIDYFRGESDPDRGYALAAMTGELTFAHARPAVIRALIAERVDPVLFAMSYDYVGDLSETVALMWPRAERPPGDNGPPAPGLGEIVETLHTTRKSDLPRQLAEWLDLLDETGRWALLKLITGALRIGVSARLARNAVAALGQMPPHEVEEAWHGLDPPYLDLFAWVEGRADRPLTMDPAPFRTPMLAHAIDAADFDALDPADFRAEWKWDGVRVQAVCGRGENGRRVTRLYARTGEDVSGSFPDLIAALAGNEFDNTAIDGELLVVRDGLVQPFGVLSRRLNRKTVSARLMAEFPSHLRAYDLLTANGQDLRPAPFDERRARLESLIARHHGGRVDLSPLIPFGDWDALAAARANPGTAGAGNDADAIEGVMLKRRDAIYAGGRQKGLWWKWKRDPFAIDAVLMYAQRGHGKQSSFYSDVTFGVWREKDGAEALVPIGKAYLGVTGDELKQLDRWVRENTVSRFGPVREVSANRDLGLVLEVAFDGLTRSTRHKSGLTMRFPRIARIRWDKPPRDADRLDTLEKSSL